MELVADIDRERSLDAMWCAYLTSNSVAENLPKNRTSVVRAFLNARYYSGAQGQFLSEEPIFLNLGDVNQVRQLSGQNQQSYLSDPQQLNSYSYGRDNPITNKDTNGKLVELFSRPIDGPLGNVGAHSSVAVVPGVGETLGPVSGANTSQPFTLGGYTTGHGALFEQADANPDYSDAFGGQNYGVAQVIVDPPQGMTQQQFDQAVINSYNGSPNTLSNSYGFMGQKRLTGNPNSNNTATSILLGAGVSASQVNLYQATLYANNFRITPGLGTSVSAPTYGQSVSSGLSATLGALKGALTQLLGVLSSKR